MSRTPASAHFAGRAGMPAGLKLLLVLALATVGCIGIYQVRSIVGPIFFALTLVLTVRPIHRFLVARHVPGFLAALASVLTLVITLLLVLAVTTWSLAELPDLVMSYSAEFNALVQHGSEYLADLGMPVDKLLENGLKQLNIGSTLSQVLQAADTLMGAMSFLAVLTLAMLFIVVDTITLRSRAAVTLAHDSQLFAALSSFERGVRQYWLVSTVFGAIVAVINGIVLYFLDVPLPLAWALFSFITNYIPNVGFVVGVIPPAVLGALADGPWTALWVVIAYSVINGVIQGIFQPKFTGEAVGLSTTVTFVSLMFWTVVIGPMGAILAVPLTLLAKALLVDSSRETLWLNSFLMPESEVSAGVKRGDFEAQFGEDVPDDEVADVATQVRELSTKLSLLRSHGANAREESTKVTSHSEKAQRREENVTSGSNARGTEAGERSEGTGEKSRTSTDEGGR